MDLKRQASAPLYEAIEKFRKKRIVPFDVPGHKRGRGNPELVDLLGERCVGIDVNSMKPLDNLCHPVSVIKEAEELTAEAFGAEHAFFMVGGTTQAAVQTRLYAAKDSVIRLIQIQRVGSETTFINDIGGYCEDGARIELVQLYLSGKNRYEGCEIKLAGDGSSMSAEIGYVAAGKERLDMNYCVRHIGKKTECAINAAGLLFKLSWCYHCSF